MFIKIIGWRLIKLSIRLQFSQVRQLSTTELAAWLQKDNEPKPLLLDARTPEEYRVSHLANAKLIPNDLEALKQGINYATPIVVYCSVGYRSAAIARQLQRMGYQNVFNLEGSIFQWVNEHRAVYREGKLTDKVHPYDRFWQYLIGDRQRISR